MSEPEGSKLVELDGALAASEVTSALPRTSLSCARSFDVSSRIAIGSGITSICLIMEAEQLGHIFCCDGERRMSIGMQVFHGEKMKVMSEG